MNPSLSALPMTAPDFYSTHYRKYHEKTFYIDPSGFLLPFVQHLKPGAHVLDIGCGSGRDLLWLKKKGFDPVGVERSQGLADLARHHSGCRVISGDFHCFDFSGMEADGILLAGALVHLEKTQVLPVLERILQGLKPEGILFFSVKQGEGCTADGFGRRFHLWHREELHSVVKGLPVSLRSTTSNRSALETGETWLGVLVEKINPK